MNLQHREDFIVRLMHAGFSKAAQALTRLMGCAVKSVKAQSSLLRPTEIVSRLSLEQDEMYVLTTQIFGDAAGKSFFFLNWNESQEILKAAGNPSGNALKEAFLLEIDNIISASVIAEISNSLKVEVYGDVPALQKIGTQAFQSFVAREIGPGAPADMIYNATSFQFEGHDHVSPQFVWKLNSKILGLVSGKAVA